MTKITGPFEEHRLNALQHAIIACIKNHAATCGHTAETHERGFAGMCDDYFQQVTLSWMTVELDQELRKLGYHVAPSFRFGHSLSR